MGNKEVPYLERHQSDKGGEASSNHFTHGLVLIAHPPKNRYHKQNDVGHDIDAQPLDDAWPQRERIQNQAL